MAGVAIMFRYQILRLFVGAMIVPAATGLAVADSSFDMRGGQSAVVRPTLPHSAREEITHPNHFRHPPDHTVVGVPLFFFDEEMPEPEPDVVIMNPPPLSPQPTPCPPGPPEKTFTTETTNGVSIIRGHSDRC